MARRAEFGGVIEFVHGRMDVVVGSCLSNSSIRFDFTITHYCVQTQRVVKYLLQLWLKGGQAVR